MKSTIVSIVPFEVRRDFPGVFPGTIIIPLCKDGDPEVIHVPDGKTHRYILDNEGVVLPIPGEELASAFVNDFVRSQLAYSDDAYPGIFWLEGVVTKADVKAKHKDKLEEARKVQERWFRGLVRLADDDWQKHHQYKIISDLQRRAAKWLGLVREWVDVVDDDKTNCPYCGYELKRKFPICANCKAILDESLAKNVKFATA